MTAVETETSPVLPTQIGKYPVLSKLGEGATSEVFLCRDEFHQRNVAVKRVRDAATRDPVDGHYYARFFAAEAALVGRLQHPHVVQIFDAVADPQEQYLVMEYVEGTTLRSYCRADQLLPLELIVELGFKCAMALGYVFRLGVIHRDVKPANILALVSNGVITDVKVTDFGSALKLDADTTQVHRVGSLSYMSPEQLEGASLDAQSDMYSLGAVLYHLITGQAPISASNQAAMIHNVIHMPPVPASLRRPDVGGAVDAVLSRALHKRPEHRYRTWEEFAQALANLITQREVPRGDLQAVLDTERFSLLRSLPFFENFGDVELWEIVHQARWQRFADGHKLMRRGEAGKDVHIIAHGGVDVWRDGSLVARLDAGTSVGEMAYLAPDNSLRLRTADVVVRDDCLTLSFTPDSLTQLSLSCRAHFNEAFIAVLVERLHLAQDALHAGQWP